MGASTLATVSATNAGVLASNVMAASAAVRVVGLVGGASLAAGQSKACDSGSISSSGNVAADGTGTVSLSFNDCRVGADTLSGAASMSIAGFNATNQAITDATVNITRISFRGPSGNGDLTGTVRAQVPVPANSQATTRTLTGNIITQDSTGRMTKTESLVLVNVYDNALAPTFFNESITGRVFDSVAGYVDVTTTTAPFTAPWGPLYFATSSQSFPDWGLINLAGAPATTSGPASRARVTALAIDLAKIEVDADGNGIFENAARMRWIDFNTAIGADLADSDGDGMHNSWETAMGLNPGDPSDANGDADGDGFSNRTEYLDGTSAATNGSVPPPVHMLWLTDARDLTYDATNGQIDVTVPGNVVPLDPVTRELGAPVPAAPPSAPADTGAFTYTTAGEQIDTATGTVVGTFAGVDPAQRNHNLVVPNASIGRVFYLTPSVTVGAVPGTWTLSAFDTNTRALLGSLDMKVSGEPGSLIRYGAKGIAFRTDIGYVFLVETSTLVP
ncbi:MAG TPA: hypothetical protein VEQ87_12965 [Burkholderiales bacterium]|nr:hypothetical protein [Burkholderiales bacterium]